MVARSVGDVNDEFSDVAVFTIDAVLRNPPSPGPASPRRRSHGDAAEAVSFAFGHACCS